MRALRSATSDVPPEGRNPVSIRSLDEDQSLTVPPEWSGDAIKDDPVMKHVKVLGLAAVFVGSLGLATAASAAPIGFGPITTPAEDVVIEQVAGGCGPGWHPNPWGECRPNRRPPPYWGDGYGYRRPPPPPDYGYGYGGPRRFYY